MAGKSRRTKFFAQRQQLPWPAPATALVACILFPCTVALRALQACISSGIIGGSVGSTPLPPVTFPWIAWPILMMGALWFRHLEGAWFTSAAVTGRAIAAAALLGVLDGCSSSLDFFVAQGCGNTATRQGVILAVLRACDIPLAAGLSALMIAYRASLPYPTTVCNAVLFSLPMALGLASASILSAFAHDDGSFIAPVTTGLCGESLLYAANGAAALCRAFRCAAGAFLLQRAGVENSIGGLFFVGGFSGFFGSMLVLPMMLGSHLASFRVDAWESGAWTLDLGVITGAILFLGTCDTVARLAVLRHSDTMTAAALDAGLTPLATLMAHVTCGGAYTNRALPTEAMALVVLLFSFLVQHQLAQHTHSQLDGPSHATTPPVLLGRALYGPADKDTEQRSRKLRDV